jgi:perosamine synthetase
MSKQFIMQMRPYFGTEERVALADYMSEDGFLTEYKRTERFERQIAEYTGARHCVVVNNGTISLTLAALALGIQAGDEVIVPNYSMIATPNSVKMIGAVPVFVDVEPETLCIDINTVESAITDSTKAIIIVSANGRYPSAGISAFENLARNRNLILIEDAAQSLGSLYPDGRHVGRAGIVGSFSFSTPKIITTGQGGALITDCDYLAQKLRRLKDFGRTTGGIDIHDTIGFNFKFTELQACVGIEQMKKLRGRVARKKEIWSRYHNNLSIVPQIRLFDHNLNFTCPWFIDSLVEDRESLVSHLRDEGIGTRVMYPPINKQVAYQIDGNFPVSTHVGERGLWLPSAVQLSNDEIDRITDSITRFYNQDSNQPLG